MFAFRCIYFRSYTTRKNLPIVFNNAQRYYSSLKSQFVLVVALQTAHDLPKFQLEPFSALQRVSNYNFGRSSPLMVHFRLRPFAR